jgi:hypothetical protein
MTDLIDIFRAEKIAQRRMADDPNWDKTFQLSIDGGLPISCVWLDPYFGLFQIKGKETMGFMRTVRLPDDAKVVVAHEDAIRATGGGQ